MERHAAYCGTRNLYGDMVVSAKSLYANSKVDRIHFIIEDSEFPDELPDFTECHDVIGQTWFGWDGPSMRNGWTWMVLMRACLCHILPDIDTVLSLDVDTVCVGDVTGIWDTPMERSYFAGVREPAKSRDGMLYVNFGVALMNLAKLRDGKADEIISVLNSQRFPFNEQDVSNYLCQGRIAELPSDFNSMEFNGGAPNPRLLHFAAVDGKIWRKDRNVRKYREMPWGEAICMHDGGILGEESVLFVSDNDLDRAENLRAVYGFYSGRKEFLRGASKLPEESGHPVVVCDTLPPYCPRKDFVSINIGHGIPGTKSYGLTEKRSGIDARGLAQVDWAVCGSAQTVTILAEQFGIDEEKCVPLGMPRTDAYFGKSKGDGGTALAGKRAYLYVPTFRGRNDGERLPRIDWRKLENLLGDDEIFAVKRHYWTSEPLVRGKFQKVLELPPDAETAPYLIDCDVVLTDYSSIMFDAWILGRPVVLSTDDMESYLLTRGMSFSYPDSYSDRALAIEGNEEGMIGMLREAADSGMTPAESERLEFVAGACDGHSSERVCDLIAAEVDRICMERMGL